MNFTKRAALGVALLAIVGCFEGDGGGEFLMLDAGFGSDAGFDASTDAPLNFDGGFNDVCAGDCELGVEGSCGVDRVCVFDGRSVCVAAESVGDTVEGEGCESALDCAPGLGCVEMDGERACRRPCCTLLDDCAEAEWCATAQDLKSNREWGVCRGTVSCDVTEPVESCGEGRGCYIVSASGETDCMVAGDLEVGESCDAVGDCRPGLLCTGLRDPICTRICELGVSGACPGGEGMCQAYAHTQPSGVGLCTIGVEVADRVR